MSQKFVRTSVQLHAERVKQVDQLCLDSGTTRSAVIRDAIDRYLDQRPGPQENPKRIAMLREFTQVALDVLIREQAPERREEILATVQDRMERYHAQG